MNEERTTSRKVRVGKVVSDKMDKTVVVTVEDHVAHKTYKKIIGNTYRLKAHDENNECGVGDIVRVMETRPLSKDKRWRVVEIVEKAKRARRPLWFRSCPVPLRRWRPSGPTPSLRASRIRTSSSQPPS